jgi:hypothetical protein
VIPRRRNDIISDMVAVAARYAPADELRQIEIDLRARFGGREVYIKKAPPAAPAAPGEATAPGDVRG